MEHLTEEMTGAAIFIDALKAFGVEYIFSVPGTTVLDIYDVLRDQQEIKLVVARHEQAAAIMADAYSRVSKKPAVVLVSRAPSICNTTIGLYGALVESSPMLLVNGTPSNAISYRDCFEEMDFAAFAKPLSKSFYRVDSISRISELTLRSLKECSVGRPGPVIMSFPVDIQRATTPSFKTNYKFIHTLIPSPPDHEVENAAALLLRSHRIVTLVGGGSLRSGATSSFIKIAQLLNSPVVNTWGRADAFPNSHPLYIGSAGPGSFKTKSTALREAETVLAVGCRFSEFTTGGYTCFTEDTKLIHVDIDPYELGKVYPPDVGIVSDAKLFAEKLVISIENQICKNSHVHFSQARKEWAAAMCEQYQHEWQTSYQQLQSSSRMKLVHSLQRILPSNTLIVLDCATFGPYLTRYYGFEQPGTLIVSAAGCLGFGFPGAMGAKLAAPERTVVAVVGDGSFLMCMQNLATAVQEKINVIVVVVNNFCYGNVAERQKTYYGGRLFGCQLNNPDFAQVAKLFGAYGERVEYPEDFAEALKKALDADLPTVIDVIEPAGMGLPAGSTPVLAR